MLCPYEGLQKRRAQTGVAVPQRQREKQVPTFVRDDENQQKPRKTKELGMFC
jgi:hypothetical protein